MEAATTRVPVIERGVVFKFYKIISYHLFTVYIILGFYCF